DRDLRVEAARLDHIGRYAVDLRRKPLRLRDRFQGHFLLNVKPDRRRACRLPLLQLGPDADPDDVALMSSPPRQRRELHLGRRGRQEPRPRALLGQSELVRAFLDLCHGCPPFPDRCMTTLVYADTVVRRVLARQGDSAVTPCEAVPHSARTIHAPAQSAASLSVATQRRVPQQPPTGWIQSPPWPATGRR